MSIIDVELEEHDIRGTKFWVLKVIGADQYLTDKGKLTDTWEDARRFPRNDDDPVGTAMRVAKRYDYRLHRTLEQRAITDKGRLRTATIHPLNGHKDDGHIVKASDWYLDEHGDFVESSSNARVFSGPSAFGDAAYFAKQHGLDKFIIGEPISRR